jgi:hypothetical protein
VNAGDDPGWRPALRPIWRLFFPWFGWFGILLFKRRLNLVGLRRQFIHMGVGLVELSIVIPTTFDEPRDADLAWLILGVGTAGCVGGLIWSTKSRWRGSPDPSDLNSAESVANGFRALSFLRLGFAASPALYGIAGSQLTQTAEVGFVGVVVSLALFAVFGPTRSRVDEIQDRLRVAGSRVSLRVALDETAS